MLWLFYFQGKDDPGLQVSLHPERLIAAVGENPLGESVIKVNLRMQDGFDHSNSIAEALFIDHFKFHRQNLDKAKSCSQAEAQPKIISSAAEEIIAV